MVSVIMGIINHNVIDNGDVEVHPSYYPFKYTSESVPYPDISLIKSIDDEKWTISWNYFTQNTMMIFWILKSR